MKKILLTFFLFLVISLNGQIITTVVGNGISGKSGDGGPATTAELDIPQDLIFDPTGNMYISFWDDSRIRTINNSGIISTFAGNGTFGYTGNGGPATAAELGEPVGVTRDPSNGNIYIADQAANQIRVVNTSGIINAFAGQGPQGFSGDGGPATAAEFNNPTYVMVDASHNVYIADRDNFRIRVVNSSGIVSTIAGNGTQGFSGDGGPATAAEISWAQKVVFDPAGNLYIADYGNNRVRKINPFGIISTFAGNGTISPTGDGGQATAAGMYEPIGIAMDGAGNFYISEFEGSRIRIVHPSGIINTIAGIGVQGYSGDGGPATAAEFNQPMGLNFDNSDNLYVADTYNNRIRKITPSCSFPVTINPVTNVHCYGSSTGSATAVPGGGTSPYTYSWAPVGQTNATAAGLSAGTYSVTVNDVNGCVGTATVTITQPNQLRDSISSQTNVSCSGMCNGSLTCGVKGGTATYTYLWSPGGQTVQTITGLCPGCYTVTVRDANSCSATATACITQPLPLKDSICSVTNISCHGGNNGCLTACASGGTPPYSYNWTNGSTSNSICNLTVGCYTVTVTDNHGCTATATNCITQPNTLTVFECGATNVSCHGGNNGCIIACVTGGTMPYSYFWSNAATSDTVCTFTAGCYTVTVTDANNCTGTMSYCLTEPGPLGAIASASPDTVCVGGCATLKVTANGNTPPYSYRWSTGATTSSVSVCPTINTTYSVTVKDSTCSDSIMTSVLVHVDVCVGVPGITASADDISVYPNPSGGIFTISAEKESGERVFEVYNILGEKVYSQTFNIEHSTFNIDLSDKPNGVYLLRIITDNGAINKRLIKIE